MAEVITCPNCGAQVYDMDGNGIQKCEYCRCVIKFDKRQTVSNIPRAVPPSPDMTETHMPDRRKKWNIEIAWLMIIHAVLVFAMCIALETDAEGAGAIVLIFDFMFALIAPMRIGLTVPRSAPNAKNPNKFLYIMIFYTIFFIEFWAAVFIGAMFTVLISHK